MRACDARQAAVVLALVGAVLLAAAACEEEAPCKVDTDCPQGTICRDERCGPVGAEAGAPQDAGPPPTTCVAEGNTCATPDECCTRICTDGRCASTVPSQPTCRQLYELCQNDCCAGLSCISGTCR